MWISSDGQDGPAAGLGFYPTDFERKVVNYTRERKKLNEKIAATSDKEEKSKLIKRLNEVEKQHQVTDSADVWARQPLEV